MRRRHACPVSMKVQEAWKIAAQQEEHTEIFGLPPCEWKVNRHFDAPLSERPTANGAVFWPPYRGLGPSFEQGSTRFGELDLLKPFGDRDGHSQSAKLVHPRSFPFTLG